MASVYLGIDVGTTSAKCLAVNEDGEILAIAQHPYPMSHPHQSWAEQDSEDYWRALSDIIPSCVSQCLEKGYSRQDIKSLAMSTQGDTLIVTDSSAIPLMPAVSWMDTRADAECREMLAESGSSFWYKRLGIPLTAFNSACAVRWISKNMPEVWGKRPHFAYVPDFLAYRLTD
jgi:sugar (pentulose or hexulose) kinase